MSRFRDILIHNATNGGQHNSSNKTVFKIETSVSNEQFGIADITGDYVIDWGDGTAERNLVHKYKNPGVYVIVISGSYTMFSLGYFNTEHAMKVTEILKVSDNLSGKSIAMFNDCQQITSVPLFDTSRFTSMETMFLNCPLLEEVPAFDTSNVTNFNRVLCNCYNLQEFPEWDFSAGTNFQASFRMNSQMRGTPNPACFWNKSNIVYSKETFMQCSALSNYNEIPASWGGGGA